MTRINFLAVVLLYTLLAGCGGGGGATAPVTGDPVLPGPTIAVPQTTEGLRGAATDLLAIWAPGGVVDYSALSVVPSNGSARYVGYIYGDLSDDTDTVTDRLIGALTLDVTFGGQDIAFTGEAGDFVDVADDPLTGSLTVSGGTLNRDGNPASDATLRGITLAGNLRDGSDTPYDVGVVLEGDFLGITAAAIGGEAIGRVAVADASQNFDGGFIVEE